MIELKQGDCLELMKDVPTGSIDLILADLPYGTTNCKWDEVVPFIDLWEQYKRIIKDKGAIVLTASQPFTSALIASNYKMFKYTWTWEKSKATGFLNAKIRPLVAHEDIVVFAKSKPQYNPQMTKGDSYNKGVRKQQTENDVYSSFKQAEIKSKGERYPRSVQYFKTAESEGKTYHKTQKPVALMEYLIKTYTNENETVLDNTMGSGTTMIACQNTNRKGIGFELDGDIFKVAQERVKNNCN